MNAEPKHLHASPLAGTGLRHTGRVHANLTASSLVPHAIRLNEGTLGRKRREGEFEKLTDDEVAYIEAIVREAFDGYEGY